MRYAHYCFYLAILFLSLTTVASASETITFPSQDGLLITADIYAPYKNSKAPMIVLFHQAGWSRGEYTEIAPWLNTLGYNCMAIDQRSGKYARGVKNETVLRAKKQNKPTGYVDALPDIKSALIYAHKHYGKNGVIAWGSSYSAALVLKVAGDTPALVEGVLAFSPGEYFQRAGKTATWIQDSAQHINVPVLITSARNETNRWAGIFAAIPSDSKVSFVPTTTGRHGSRALWREYPDSEAYRNAVKAFLERYFPTSKATRPVQQ